MPKSLGIAVVFACFSIGAQGNEFGSRSIGHVVSTTGVTLEKNEISVGTLYLGYGLTDRWTIGISPFVLTMYKMNNIESRWAWDFTGQDRVLLGFEYFKTFGEESSFDRAWREHCESGTFDRDCEGTKYPYGFTSFKMEAWDLKITYSRLVHSSYRMNITGSYYSYLDDERPFSLRMDSQNSDMHAINLTSLHEIKIRRGLFLNLEAGVWGMNYKYRYLHYGVSVNWQPHRNSLVGLGASTTHNPEIPESDLKQFANYNSRRSIHPEIQTQIFF